MQSFSNSTRPSIRPYLVPIKNSWRYVKRFKSYRVDRHTHTPTHKQTIVKTYHLRYMLYRYTGSSEPLSLSAYYRSPAVTWLWTCERSQGRMQLWLSWKPTAMPVNSDTTRCLTRCFDGGDDMSRDNARHCSVTAAEVELGSIWASFCRAARIPTLR